MDPINQEAQNKLLLMIAIEAIAGHIPLIPSVSVSRRFRVIAWIRFGMGVLIGIVLRQYDISFGGSMLAGIAPMSVLTLWIIDGGAPDSY